MPVCYHVYEKRREKMKGNVNTTKKEENTNTSFIEKEDDAHLLPLFDP
jgi:hypothetical protein|tara:strand:- start:331 stop:474 length:144 start_codon:yes stop_codon:yes gene_type:complete